MAAVVLDPPGRVRFSIVTAAVDTMLLVSKLEKTKMMFSVLMLLELYCPPGKPGGAGGVSLPCEGNTLPASS